MVRNKKIYVVKLLEDENVSETLTKADIDRLIAGQYTDYYFPDGSLHSVVPVKVIKDVVGQRLEPYEDFWGWVAVMVAGWKPAKTHEDPEEPEG